MDYPVRLIEEFYCVKCKNVTVILKFRIDCFWEGSKPLGPYPPLVLQSVVHTFLPELPEGNISWKNLDPELLLSSAKDNLGIKLDLVENFFSRVGTAGENFANKVLKSN